MSRRRQELRSARKSKELVSLFAREVRDESGNEGVMRRDTPIGTQAWITDDERLIERMLSLAGSDHRIPKELRESIYIVRFNRVLGEPPA